MSTVVITSDADYNQTEENGRLQIWSRGIGYMVANPVLGLGPGNFQENRREGTLSALAARQQFGIRVSLESRPTTATCRSGVKPELGFPGLVLSPFSPSLPARFRRCADRGGSFAPALVTALPGSDSPLGSFFLSLAPTRHAALYAGGPRRWPAEGHGAQFRHTHLHSNAANRSAEIESDGPGGAEQVVADLAVDLQESGSQSVVFLPAAEGLARPPTDRHGRADGIFRPEHPISPACARSLAWRRFAVTGSMVAR